MTMWGSLSKMHHEMCDIGGSHLEKVDMGNERVQASNRLCLLEKVSACPIFTLLPHVPVYEFDQHPAVPEQLLDSAWRRDLRITGCITEV